MILKQITHKDIEVVKKTNAILRNVYFVIKEIKSSWIDKKYNTLEDMKERKKVLLSCNKLVSKLKNKDSRQACLSLNYYTGFTRCASIYHAFVVDNTINLNVYFRSMNYNKNIEYDCATFYLLLKELSKKLKLQRGEIIFIINNLHGVK